MKLHFEGLQKPTGRAQRVGEKNGVLYLFIIFSPRVMVIKMSKLTRLLYFPMTTAKLVSVWANYLRSSERSYLALLENAINYWLLRYH